MSQDVYMFRLLNIAIIRLCIKEGKKAIYSMRSEISQHVVLIKYSLQKFCN